MERQFYLKTSDERRIFCVHNTCKKSNQTVAVLVHGLTGDPFSHTFYTAARTFPHQGVDVFRFALYWYENGCRTLKDCTLDTHVVDLERVLKYVRKKYKTVYVVGHSLGSPTILGACIELYDGVVLWDPSYLQDGIRHNLQPVTVQGKKYLLDTEHISYLLHPKLVEQWEWFNGKNELELLTSLEKPLKIIAAKKGILVPGAKKYFQAAQEPKSLVIVPGASHCFDEADTADLLLNETLSWITRNK